MYITAEFLEKDSLVRGIKFLRDSGLQVTDEDLAIFSEEPVELAKGVLDRPSRMSLVAVLGAILTGGLATAGVYWAQHNYALDTGGMPTFSMWGTGIITYETTLLGSILAVFVWFLWESGIIRTRDKSAPVPLVPPGSMCLRVKIAGDAATEATDLMRRAGAVGVDRKD